MIQENIALPAGVRNWPRNWLVKWYYSPPAWLKRVTWDIRTGKDVYEVAKDQKVQQVAALEVYAFLCDNPMFLIDGDQVTEFPFNRTFRVRERAHHVLAQRKYP